MSQVDLVAAYRAYKRAQEQAQAARDVLEREIQDAVHAEEWQIIDIAELTGWSRETVRKIANKT